LRSIRRDFDAVDLSVYNDTIIGLYIDPSLARGQRLRPSIVVILIPLKKVNDSCHLLANFILDIALLKGRRAAFYCGDISLEYPYRF
jgi:hypothetical protein